MTPLQTKIRDSLEKEKFQTLYSSIHKTNVRVVLSEESVKSATKAITQAVYDALKEGAVDVVWDEDSHTIIKAVPLSKIAELLGVEE